MRRSELARADGFDHIDVMLGDRSGTLVLPIGCPIGVPEAGAHVVRDPGTTRRRRRVGPDGPVVARRAAGVVRTVGRRFGALDRAGRRPAPTRSRACGSSSTPVTSPTGAATCSSCCRSRRTSSSATPARRDPGRAGRGRRRLRRVLRRLEALDYDGVLSIEYFDLPEHGWPLRRPAHSRTRSLRVAGPMNPAPGLWLPLPRSSRMVLDSSVLDRSRPVE